MKALCAAGKNQELNCCGNIDSTSCYNDPILASKHGKNQLAPGQMKSIFSGPNFNVDIEFKEVSYSVKVKGRGKMNLCCVWEILSFYFQFTYGILEANNEDFVK